MNTKKYSVKTTSCIQRSKQSQPQKINYIHIQYIFMYTLSNDIHNIYEYEYRIQVIIIFRVYVPMSPQERKYV